MSAMRAGRHDARVYARARRRCHMRRLQLPLRHVFAAIARHDAPRRIFDMLRVVASARRRVELMALYELSAATRSPLSESADT